MNTTQILEALAARTNSSNAGHSGGTGSGASWKWTAKAVSGHIVEAHRVVDLGGVVNEWFEVDHSMEQLTFAETVARVTA